MPATAALRPAPSAPPDPEVRTGGGGGSGSAVPGGLGTLGIWLALGPIAMLFVSFASAYVVRRGLGGGWAPVALPPVIWASTAVLALSSATLETGRRREKRAAGSGWVWATLALGLLFLAGQLAAWAALQGRGVDMRGSPYGAFFYVLTGGHALHLLGGLGALAAAAVWPRHGGRWSRGAALRVTAIYWHFLLILWLGIVLLLVLGR